MKEIKLICKSVWFYSQLDEKYFFEWLQNIKAITRYDGIGDELYLYCKSSVISDQALRDILGLFYRYKVDMKQLAVFLNSKNKEWFFGNPKGYWHKRVFGITKK